jgi:hypothetical protein
LLSTFQRSDRVAPPRGVPPQPALVVCRCAVGSRLLRSRPASRVPCRVTRHEHDEGAGRNLPDLTPIHPAPGLSLREIGGCPIEPYDLTTAQRRHNFVERLALG